MIIDWRKRWWLPGFVPPFLAIGVPYWQIPYNKVNLPDALFVSMALWLAHRVRNDDHPG